MSTAATRAVVLVALAAWLTAPAGAGPFAEQRLFTTAQQRARIDGAGAAPSAGEARETGAPEDRADAAAQQDRQTLVLEGIVRRPDAPAIFWLGGHRFRAGQALPAELPARRGRVSGDGVVLTLADGRELRLEPGEALDRGHPVGSADAP